MDLVFEGLEVACLFKHWTLGISPCSPIEAVTSESLALSRLATGRMLGLGSSPAAVLRRGARLNAMRIVRIRRVPA